MQQQQQQQPFPPDQSANRQFNFFQGYSIEKKSLEIISLLKVGRGIKFE